MKLIFILIICSSFFALYPQAKWEKLKGPEGGMPSAIVAKGDTILIGTGFYKGMIFYSFDKGSSWNKANIKLSFTSGQQARINDFVFSEDGGILAACGKYGIYKSFDFHNWQNILQNGEDYWSIGKDYLGNIYVGTNVGKIYESTDHGIIWSLSLNGNYMERIVKFLSKDSLYYAGSYKKIYKKEINSSWQSILFNSNQSYFPFTNDLDLFCNSSSFIYKKINNDDTWSLLDTNHFFSGNYIYNVIFNNRMIAACGDEIPFWGNGWGIALSDDGGLTWRWQNNGLPPRLASAYKLAKSGQDTYVTLNAAGVYKSTNFGESWFSSNNSLHAAEVLDITFDKEGALYTASWCNGIFKSTDKGQTWQKKNNGLKNSYLYSIIADTNGNLIAGTSEGFFRSTDQGENWVQGPNLETNFFYKLYLDKKNRIYAIIYGSGTYRTTNLGVTWQLIDPNLSEYSLSAFTIDQNGNYYAGTRLGYIYKSTNEGSNWTLLRSTPYLPNSIIEGIVVAPNGYIFAANTSEGVLKSTDSGITWVNKDNGLLNYAMTCLAVNKNGDLYLSTKGDKLHFSSDDGETWIDVTSNLAQTWVKNMTFDKEGNLFLATDESVWMNKDAIPVELIAFSASVEGNDVNLHWSTATELNNSGFDIERNNGDSPKWSSIAFINGQGNTTEKTEYSHIDKNLLSGKYKYRLKQTDYNGSYKYHGLSSEVAINIPAEFRLEQNYPNPFNPLTKIKYQIPKEGRVILKLYDLLGKEVLSVVDEIKPAGLYETEINAEKLSSGVYFYRLSTPYQHDVKKLQILK